VQAAAPAEYASLNRAWDATTSLPARDSIHAQALALAGRVTHHEAKDVNYVIPRFVIDHLPIGLAGIFIAAVIAAAMNAISGELASLSTASVIDFYKRWVRNDAPDAHFLVVSRAATVFWGLLACVVATYAVNLGSLIEVVNRFGSFFYGSILGVFLLAMIPRASARGAFVGLIAGMATVGTVNFVFPKVAFLWHNVFGAVAVVAIGMIVSAFSAPPPVRTDPPLALDGP
jgi:Na+/proline symporter